LATHTSAGHIDDTAAGCAAAADVTGATIDNARAANTANPSP
jgi:hypothetical protein